MMASFPWASSSSGAWTSQPRVGSMPPSMLFLSASRIGQAENLTAQPLGISDEKGRPPQPPVLAPATTTLGSDFITDVKSLAALKHERLVSNTIGPQ